MRVTKRIRSIFSVSFRNVADVLYVPARWPIAPAELLVVGATTSVATNISPLTQSASNITLVFAKSVGFIHPET